MLSKKKFLIYHVGARDHYSVAKFFAAKGYLEVLMTDYWLNIKTNLLPLKVQKLISRRFEPQLKSQKVFSFSFLEIFYTYFKKKKITNSFERWLFNDQYFTAFVIKKIKQKSLKPKVIWGYTNANLEVLEYFKDKPVFKIHNQIDPGIEYYHIQQNLWQNNKEMEDQPELITKEFHDRIKNEWDLANLIIVNSAYSKKSLVKHGVNSEKIEVLPLIINQDFVNQDKKFNKKLIVAFVGNINLVKGFLLFINVAKRLHENIEFVAIGNFKLKQEIKDATSDFINYTGQLPKIEMIEWYKKIDILIFPSLCDGFGMVQLEAMKNGIPVLATINCGEVVQDGFNGKIIASQDDAIKSVEFLNRNREELSKYSQNAINTVKQFSEEEFGKSLNLIFAKHNLWS